MLCFYQLAVAGLVFGDVPAARNVDVQVGIMTGCHSRFWVARQACLEALWGDQVLEDKARLLHSSLVAEAQAELLGQLAISDLHSFDISADYIGLVDLSKEPQKSTSRQVRRHY